VDRSELNSAIWFRQKIPLITNPLVADRHPLSKSVNRGLSYRPLEAFFLRSVHRFFIISDNRFRLRGEMVSLLFGLSGFWFERLTLTGL
jgi:hypothetical protein